MAETWRNAVPELKLQVNCGGGSIKSQMKKADKSGANLAFILGDDELDKNEVTVKFLREKRDQEIIELEKVADYLKNNS